MKYTKIYKVKSPTIGTELSAGIDFYIPEFTESFSKRFLSINNNITLNFDSNFFRLAPHERVNIPSGIKVELKENQCLIAFNKSGVSTKLGLDVLACVIDSDYQGEIHLSLVNTSINYIDLYAGQKIVQFILFNIPKVMLIEVSEKSMYLKKTKRSKNGFGSTGEF